MIGRATIERRVRARSALAAFLAAAASLGGAGRGPAGALGLGARAVAAQSGRETAIALETPTGILHGTLLQPVSPHLPRTVALIVAGSGPTDRDGNSPLLPGANNSLRYLAEELAHLGIASLRYDKRGIAESAGAATSEADLRFDHYVEDAAAWVRRLRSSGEYDRVVAIGHSEGALVVTLVAQREAVDALVLLAGTGRPLGEVLREQLAAQLPPAVLAQAETILVRLEAGRTAENVPAILLSLFRPSVQPYLISQLTIHPAMALAEVAIAARGALPILIVNGTTDIQVSAERDAVALAAAAPSARLEIVEGMNHILKLVGGTPAEQTPSYSDPSLPLAPALVEILGEFLTAR